MGYQRELICPHCHAIAETITDHNGGVLLGCPFRVCRSCGKIYFDDRYREPAVCFYNDIKPVPFPFGQGLRMLGLFAVTVFWLIVFWMDPTHLTLIGIAFSGFLLYDAGEEFLKLLWDALNRKQYEERIRRSKIEYLESPPGHLTAEIRLSMERLSSIPYLSMLTQSGVGIPDYFYQRARQFQQSASDADTQLMVLVDQTPPRSFRVFRLRRIENKEKSAPKVSGRFHDICLFISLAMYVVFFVFYWKADPLAWRGDYLVYLVVIGVCLLVFGCMIAGAKTMKRCVISVVIPVALLTIVLSAYAVYYLRLDVALADIPDSGEIYTRITVTETYYTSEGGTKKGVLNSDVRLRVGSEDSLNNIYRVLIHQPIPVEADVSYEWVVHGERKGSSSVTVTLTAEQLREGQQFTVKVPVSEDEWCELDIKVEYVVGFWDVVLS